MKTRIFMVLIPICLVGVIITVAAISHLRYRYSPSVEHESTFLRNYSPRHVIESFAFKKDPLSMGDGIGSGAGSKFVTNERKIDSSFSVRSDMRTPLMTALSGDVLAQLGRDGGTIISRRGDPESGFHFVYKDATSIGNVTLFPLSDQARSSLSSTLAEGVKEVRANIVISEKWFPQEAGAEKASMEIR